MSDRQDETPWWQLRRAELMALAESGTPRYVYDTTAALAAVMALKALRAVDRLFYAIKANPHPALLTALHAAGLGFETVSPGELARVTGLFPELEKDRILFTPNFAPRGEYAEGFARGATVTLDNLHPLREWPELLRGREFFLRVDTGNGAGHHSHVRTAGEASKFGIPLTELREAMALASGLGARVTGLHAHVGSGIMEPKVWGETASLLAELSPSFPDLQVLDSGWGARHTGATRRTRPRSQAPGRGTAGGAARLSTAAVVAGTGPLLGGPGRSAAHSGHAAQGQGQSALPRRGRGYELPHPPGALRGAP